MPYRLTAIAPKEADLQEQILDYLRARQIRGDVAWYARINGGGAMVVGKGGRRRFMSYYRLFLRGFSGSKGISDLIGQTASGIFFAVEIKRPGELASTSEEQRAFLDAVRKAGGRGIVASGWEEVKAMLEAK